MSFNHEKIVKFLTDHKAEWFSTNDIGDEIGMRGYAGLTEMMHTIRYNLTVERHPVKLEHKREKRVYHWRIINR